MRVEYTPLDDQTYQALKMIPRTISQTFVLAIAIVLPNTAPGQMLTQVADIDPSGDSFPDFMTVFDDHLYYRAFDGTADRLMRYSPSNDLEIADTINPLYWDWNRYHFAIIYHFSWPSR